MSPADGAPEEFDQTIFAVNADRTIGSFEPLALNLVKDQQRYTKCCVVHKVHLFIISFMFYEENNSWF